MAYYGLEPWGPERADLNAGIVASTLANVNRDAKRRPKPFTPDDFMPKYGEAKPDPATKLDPKLMRAKFHAAFGPAAVRKSRPKTDGRK